LLGHCDGSGETVKSRARAPISDPVPNLSTLSVSDSVPATRDALTESAPAEWRTRLAELLAQHAIGFLHLSPPEVDAALVAALKAIGEFIGAGRASLWRSAPDRTQIVLAHEWHATGATPLPAGARTVRVEPVAAGPDDVAAGYRLIDPVDGRDWLDAGAGPAYVVIPLQVADRLIGVVRFDAAGAEPWPSAVHRLLGPFGELCTNAIVAQRAIAGLEASELRHRSVLDEVGDVIVRIGPDGALSYVNRAWSELTGNPIADTVGADPLANVHPEDRALAMEHMAAAIAGKPGVREVRFLAHGGDVRWMEVKGRAVFDADGNMAGFSGVLHDVTQRRAAEARAQAAREEAERARDEAERARDEAEQAREQAERASRAKSEFLSRMSHELRTPLNAILGFTQLLEFAELSGEDADNLSMISRAGRHLLSLINDTLDVSRIESGRLSMSLEPVPVADVAKESLDLVRTDAADRRLTLRTRAEGVAPHVVADRQRLKQVLVNLLSNAVKYNRAGGEVRIAWAVPSAETAPDLASPFGWLRIEVSDTGLGIAADRFDDLFLPFERLGAERTEIEGTGIGLALAKNLVDAMGGRIGVRSVRGVGSTFYVDLPRAEVAVPVDDDPDGADPDSADIEDSAAHTVLYIEDNPSNTMLMRRIFTRRPQVRLLVAGDGEAGLAMVGEHRPDLVLLDLHLPRRSGEEVLAEIRRDPAISATPVVIVTADLTPGTERRLSEAGATDFMSKPVDIGRLLHVVDRELRVE
jgi:PAS domain S-box-containing protein